MTYLGGDALAALLVGGLIGGLLLVGALLFVDGGALLVGHGPLNLLALLLIRGAALLLVLGLVAGGGHGRALLTVGGGALRRVDGVVDGLASRALLGQEAGVDSDGSDETENNEKLKN